MVIEVGFIFLLFAVVLGEKWLRYRRYQMRAGRVLQSRQVKAAMDVAGRINQYGISVEAPLTPDQMDELDKYAHMEELAECEEMREIGFRQLEWYANWKKAA